MNRKKAILKKSIEFTRRVRAIKITLSFGFAVFSVVGLLIAFNLDALRLSRISVSGARVVSGEDISHAAAGALHGSYFYLIPHSNALLYPRERVRVAVTAVSPRIKNVRLRVRGYSTLIVQVLERTPAALWCPAVEQAHCLYLDESGFAFGIAPFFRGDSYLVFTSSRTPAVGFSLMDEGAFAALQSFARSFPVPLVGVTAEEERYTLKTREGYDILVNPQVPFDITRTSVLAALASEALASKLREGKELLYLDARVLGKAFYKLED